MRSRSRSNLVHLVLRVCLNYIHCAIATTSIISQLDNSSSPAIKDLSLALGIDPRLKLFTRFYEGYLPSRSCLMHAVEALAFLAGKDYQGTIPQTKTSVPGYTDIEIVIRPPDGELTVPVKPAALGLYLAVLTMSTDPAMQEMFQIAAWGILWDDIIVAYILWQHTDSRNQKQTQNVTGLPSGTINDTTPVTLTEVFNNGNSTNSTNSTNTAVELIMTFYPWGTPLREMSVFVTVLGALLDVAQYPSTNHVANFEINVPVSDVAVAFFNEASTGLTGPPSFEYRWVIQAAKQIPEWMIQHRFWESLFTIEVNDYVVGGGWVRRAARAGLDGNWTTS